MMLGRRERQLMVNYPYLYTSERTSHLMRFYSPSSGRCPGKYLFLLHQSRFNLLGFILSTMQQFRGTSLSARHRSKHGKSGEDGQRHDKGKALTQLNT